MEYELWYSEQENSYELVPTGGGNAAVRANDAIVVTKFEAPSWEAALEQKRQFIQSDKAS